MWKARGTSKEERQTKKERGEREGKREREDEMRPEKRTSATEI
jgi:hypothetical protein